MGTFCKGSAIVVFILDFIGSIVLGNIFSTPGKYSFSDPIFNWPIFLYGIIAGFLFCLFLYAIGEIIDKLETSNSETYEIYRLLKKNVLEEEKKTELIKSYLTSSQPAEKEKEPQKSERKWLCNSCGKLRDTSPCPYCGKE